MTWLVFSVLLVSVTILTHLSVNSFFFFSFEIFVNNCTFIPEFHFAFFSMFILWRFTKCCVMLWWHMSRSTTSPTKSQISLCILLSAWKTLNGSLAAHRSPSRDWSDCTDAREPRHDKTKKMSVHPAKTWSVWASAQSDQSLRLHPAKTWSVWASAQSDQSLRCLHEESLGP